MYIYCSYILFARFPFVAVSVPQISDHISPESLPFRFGGVLEGKFPLLFLVATKGSSAKNEGFDAMQNY